MGVTHVDFVWWLQGAQVFLVFWNMRCFVRKVFALMPWMMDASWPPLVSCYVHNLVSCFYGVEILQRVLVMLLKTLPMHGGVPSMLKCGFRRRAHWGARG